MSSGRHDAIGAFGKGKALVYLQNFASSRY